MLQIVQNEAGALTRSGWRRFGISLRIFPEQCYGYFLNKEDDSQMAAAKKKTIDAPKHIASLVTRALGGAWGNRYNEAVNDGFLPCAPPTVQGGARPLEHIDVLGAAIFFRCLAMGMPSRFAGKYTCLAVDVMRRHSKPNGSLKIFKVAIAHNDGKEPTARGIASFSDLAEIENESVITFDLSAIGGRVKAALDGVL